MSVRRVTGLPLAVAAFVAVAALAVGGCRRAPDARRSAGSGEASWFVVEKGQLRAADAPRAESTTEGLSGAGVEPGFLPWTLQARVADLLVRDGTLYVGVNGHGLATTPFPPQPGARFTPIYAQRLFAGRTITELFSDPSGLLLHLYVNQILAATTSGAPAPVDGPLCLLAYHGPLSGDRSSAYVPVAVPFQSVHPSWEAVAVVRVSAGTLALEWKRTGEDRTEFAYTTLEWRDGVERAIDRQAFRDAYGFVAAASPLVDASVRALFDAVARHVEPRGTAATSTAVHLVLRSDGQPAARYRYQPPGYAEREDVDLVSVPARKVGDGLWALTGDGALFSTMSGQATVAVQSLPALPASHRYTAFSVADEGAQAWIAAAWEETSFAKVGASGLYVGQVRAPGL